MISAEEAKNLSGKPIAEVLRQLEENIIKAAEAGLTSIRVPYDLCSFNGYSAKFKNSEVEKTLTELGYKIHTRSEDRQFVDVWMEISWG